jgi:hypothetical protein
MNHLQPSTAIHDLNFVPYDDVLGFGHGKGISSIVVPGTHTSYRLVAQVEVVVLIDLKFQDLESPTLTVWNPTYSKRRSRDKKWKFTVFWIR